MRSYCLAICPFQIVSCFHPASCVLIVFLPSRLAGTKKGGSCESGKYTDMLEKLLVDPERPDISCQACLGLLSARGFDGRQALSSMLDGGNGDPGEAEPVADEDKEDKPEAKKQKQEEADDETYPADVLARMVSPHLEAGFVKQSCKMLQLSRKQINTNKIK